MVVLGSIAVVMLTYQVANAVSASFSFESRKVNANTSGLIGNGGNNTITFWQRGADNDTFNHYTTDKPSSADDFEKALCRLGYAIDNNSYSLSGKQLFYIKKATSCGSYIVTSGAVDDELATWLKTGLSNGAEKKPEGFTIDDLSTCTMTVDYYRSNGIPDEKRAILYAEGKRTDVCQDYGLKLLGIKPGTKTSPNTISKIGGNAPTKTNAPIPDTIKKLINSTSQTYTNPEATIAAASGSDTEKLACAASMKGGVGTVLKWFACPIVDGMVSLAAFTDNVINSLLTINTSTIFGYSDAAKSYHDIWANFRNLAAGLIVIAALIMVVSQVAGLEIMSAYTVRKVLPRLLFAVVFIASSWAVLGLLISLSNDLGTGIRSLFYGPFIRKGANSLSFGTALLLQFFGFTGLAAGVAYGIVAFGWIGLFLFAITAVLGALVAFAVIVFRELLVTVLVVMAPLAIAASILPNTQKFWTMWKSALLSVLIVFPIISAMIAGGHVLAFVAARDQGDLARQVVGFIAYFAPYFLLPMAFKMAGGLIGTVTGMVNDRSKGVFDRLRNARGNIVKNNMDNLKHGQRFKGNTSFGRWVNDKGFAAGAFANSKDKSGFIKDALRKEAIKDDQGNLVRDKNGRVMYRGGIRNLARSDGFSAQRTNHSGSMGTAMQYHSALAGQRSMGTTLGNLSKYDDDVNRALASGKTEHEARQNMAKIFNLDLKNEKDKAYIDSTISKARVVGFGAGQQQMAATHLIKSGTGIKELSSFNNMMYVVSDGNKEAYTALAGNLNSATAEAGRYDLKTGVGKHINAFEAIEKSGGKMLTENDGIVQDNYVAAFEGNTPYQIVSSKTVAVENISKALNNKLNSAVEAGDMITASRITSGINELDQASKNYASGDNARAAYSNATVKTINQREQTLDYLESPKEIVTSGISGEDKKIMSQEHQKARETYAATTNSYQLGQPVSNPGDIKTSADQLRRKATEAGVVIRPSNPNDPNDPTSPMFKK